MPSLVADIVARMERFDQELCQQLERAQESIDAGRIEDAQQDLDRADELCATFRRALADLAVIARTAEIHVVVPPGPRPPAEPE